MNWTGLLIDLFKRLLEELHLNFRESSHPEPVVQDLQKLTRQDISHLIEINGGAEKLDLSGQDLSDIDLSGMNLSYANFSRVKLYRANLSEAFLEHVTLEEARCWRADMKRASLWAANLRSADLGECDLREANLRSARLQGAILTDAKLAGADLREAVLSETHIDRESLGEQLVQENASQFRQYVHQAEERLIPFRGVVFTGEQLERRVNLRAQEARRIYTSLKNNFVQIGRDDAASWAYRKERRMEKLEARQAAQTLLTERKWKEAIVHSAKFASDQLVECVCDYGESIPRVFGSLLAVCLLFTLIYGVTWSVVRVDHTPTATILEPTRNLIDLALFSLGAMTTMDSTGLEPRTSWVQLLVGFEALLGITLTGLLGFVLGNRIRRS